MTEIQSLLLMKATLESANLHGVEGMLDDDCEYVSTGRGIIARNKRESLEFLTAMVDSIQSDHVPVVVLCILQRYTKKVLYFMRGVMV